MNKILLFLVIISITTLSCNEKKKSESGFSVQLNLTGFKDSTEFKLLDLDKGEFIDSTKIYDNKLNFKGNVKEPFSARIHTIDNKYLILWIENGEIEVQGDFKDFGNSAIKGTPLNTVYVKYREKQKILSERRDSLTQLMIKSMSSKSENAEKEFKKLNLQVKEIDNNMFKIRTKSIASEEPSLYTIKELYFLRNDFKKDSLKLLFNRFPEKYQANKYGQVINTYIQNETLKIGDKYLDISGINNEGENVSLSELKGKYVLLDFWASWCGPCRQENPNLVRLYKKYNKKGFDIFSFSTDDNIKSWEKAVEKDSISWTSVIDKNGSYSKMSALYNVRAIPASFLINPEGIIIAKNLRGKSLENKLIEEIEKNGL